MRQLTTNAEHEMLKRNARGMVLEIGSYDGASALAMLESKDVLKIHCIDPFWNYGEDGIYPDMVTFLANTAKYRKSGRLILHNGKSEHILSFFADNSFDFIFIDGNHKTENVKYDLEHSVRCLQSGGSIGLHDYSTYPGTQFAYNLLRNMSPLSEAVDYLFIAKGIMK